MTRNKIKKTKWDYFNSGSTVTKVENRNINKQQNFNKRMKEKKFFSFITTLLLLMSVVITTKAQFGMPPTNIEGWAVATHSSGNWVVGSLTNTPVIGLVNTRNCDGLAPFGVNWTSATTTIYHGPTNNWIASNLGQVYGIAIDSKNNIYTTSTSVYNHVAEPLEFGPAGPGGVYKIDYASGNISNILTSSIYTTSATSSIGTSKIPNGDGVNHGPGLGNICYDKDNDKLYVTNMEDGRIYRINPTTNKIDAVYDPGASSPIAAPLGTTNPTMNADGGTNGFAPIGERLWGIGYNPVDKRIYYSVWVEGYGSNSPTTYNVIRSVSVNAAGFIPTSDQFEFKLLDVASGYLPNSTSVPPIFYSMPISDIEFTLDGKKMLVGECGVNQNYSEIFPINTGHSNRVFEYRGAAGSWIFNQTINLSVAGSFTHLNSSGGVDYGVSYNTPTIQGQCGQAKCDSIIWTTGNFLVNSPLVYGLQSTPASGNTPATATSLGHFVDLNGIFTQNDKTQIGDVDIFKGECKGAIPSPCDKIDVTANSLSQTRGDCCWDFTVSGLIPAGTFDHITATPITPGVFFSSTSAPAGWGTNLVSNIASWSPTSGPIITDSTSGLKSCFVNTSGSAVFSVQFAFYTTQGGVCYDTVRLDCAPVQIQNDSCCAPNIVRATCINSSQNGSSYSITMSI
ncbi:MAG: hypothetical protein IPP08_12075 [Chlorobiota bacterium]|nr:MAG: hypothetical protein IPP08_12075 [Chlorobiota bacterium]